MSGPTTGCGVCAMIVASGGVLVDAPRREEVYSTTLSPEPIQRLPFTSKASAFGVSTFERVILGATVPVAVSWLASSSTTCCA